MNVLDGLQREYKGKQEGRFLKTFMNVLDKMSKELNEAQEAYHNVNL